MSRRKNVDCHGLHDGSRYTIRRPPRTIWAGDVVRFYSQRGTAEQWIKEEKYALKWTRLSCRRFIAIQVRLQLFALAYNLGNFLRRLVLPKRIRHWSLTTLREKLIKIGAKIVHHARYVTFSDGRGGHSPQAVP